MKIKKTLQQPLVIMLLVLVMIVSLAIALYYSQPIDEEGETPVSGLVGLEDVRSGNQEAKITILPSDAPDEDAESEPLLLPEPAVVSDVEDVEKTTVDLATPAGENVQFKIDRFKKLATQPLKFKVFDEGFELTPEYLKTVQGEKVHFYLVHANLREFHHIVPNYANGWWNASAKMPTPGTYYAYVVAHPLKKSPVKYKYNLIVREESPTDIAKPDPTTGLEFNDGKHTAKMTMQRLDEGRFFTFNVLKDGSNALIEPYLESLGQVSFFKHGDPSVFAGVSSNLSTLDQEGFAHFTTGQLSPGRYTAFAEFKLGGKVYIFPFTFDIGSV